MSEIDGGKHYRLALFYGIPVYQPIEPNRIGYRNAQDGHRMPKQSFDHNVQAGQIIIGGGGGEHPAIIFHDVEHAVACYLADTLTEEVPQSVRDKAAAISDLHTIEYCDWRNRDHVEFRATCCDFDATSGSFESWLLWNVGEFVFHAIPDFTPMIKQWHDAIKTPPEPCFRGMSIPLDTYSGRGMDRFKIVDVVCNRDVRS